MQVFKFGGASVDSAKGVQNVAAIIAQHLELSKISPSEKSLVVIFPQWEKQPMR